MIQDDFERFQAEADEMIGQLTPDLDAFLGYKTEIFNVEDGQTLKHGTRMTVIQQQQVKPM